MKKLLLVTVFSCFAFQAQAEDVAKTPEAAPEKAVSVSASMIDNEAAAVGTVELVQGTKGVLLHVDLNGLPAGKHGFHIHHTGDCGDHDHFKNAGGHISQGDVQHGLMNPEGPELGDLPNLIVHKDGSVQVELYAPDLMIEGGEHAILDEDGSAFMIHINPDDHMTQPIGGAGPRIACGVIKKN